MKQKKVKGSPKKFSLSKKGEKRILTAAGWMRKKIEEHKAAMRK